VTIAGEEWGALGVGCHFTGIEAKSKMLDLKCELQIESSLMRGK
jgi:hypothetical protein